METRYVGRIIKIGNSYGISIPNNIRDLPGLELIPGDFIEIGIIQKVKKACLELISHDLNFFI